ncbi:AAA+-type ATPase [Mycoemilia scoparia]|uniref:AAA+-type ATPase n=1 Tax=Mycoemilia scoparia TaxID=417184 RepID=A0A9W8DWP1_9FUNG|nr:AAA+-type ATPase [Mycoemilia scoparia]
MELGLSSVALLSCGARVGDRISLSVLDDSPSVLDLINVEPMARNVDVGSEYLSILVREYLFDIAYVAIGMFLDITYQGRPCRFTIKNISLSDGDHVEFGLVSKKTKIKLTNIRNDDQEKDIEKGKKSTRYEDIGGLKEEVKSMKPPKGVLLYGPPGTGKTLIARAVASETGAHSIVVNGAEIMSKFYGETESRIRNIFEEAAAKAPSIIFIDEIDALCPKRDSAGSEVEKRVVATLLTLMDGVDTKEGSMNNISDKVVVIAATNRPNSLDEALRRPGRFDREIEIGIPNPNDRFSILLTITKDIPSTLTENQVRDLANKTHGYVGADLAAVCREAGLIAIRRHVKLGENDLAIGISDMEEALGVVKPSTMREVMLEVPNVKWEDIGGQEEIKQKLKESVEWPLKLFSKWVGESEKAVHEVFRKARAASPSIIFFDEIDAIAVKRGSSSDSTSVADRVLSQLLNEMDGVEPLVNVTVVAATNRPDIIDGALLRPGRIDCILYVGPPDLASRKAIFDIQIKKMSVDKDVSSAKLAEMTDGYSGAEVVALCQEAAMEAMDEDIDAQKVEMRHFTKCHSKSKLRITLEMLEFYKSFKEKSGLHE